MFCPRCNCAVDGTDDVLNNQRVTRCERCGRVLCAGEMLPDDERAQPLTSSERYRPTAKDGVSRSKHYRKFRKGCTLAELPIFLALTALLCALAFKLHWI